MCISENERNYLQGCMEELLGEYDYQWTDYGLNQIIDEWVRQKGWLIELFKKHPNYIDGKFMIAFDVDYDRELNENALCGFAQWITQTVAVEMIDSVPEEIKQQRGFCRLLPSELFDFLEDLGTLITRTIDEETAEKLNTMVPAVHAHNGQKTSRVINKLCTYLGYNKHPNYNREFAKYADALNPLTIKRHTILSLNPLDYLTMSFGNSWASCHTIDKTNKRDMPNSYEGQYSSGTMSYMLDPSSMVFYTVDKSYNGNEYWTQPKINRQMFHYGEDKLVQGRLYPQDNDGSKAVYTPYRNIVQEIMSKILEVPNLWTLRVGTGPASEFIQSQGTHYEDYQYYSNCSLSTIKGSGNENCFQVGARPICIECGSRHDTAHCINCCHGIDEVEYCDDCGRELDPDDVIWIDGTPYCRHCVSYCNHCDEYFRGNGTWVEGDRYYVCPDCLEEDYRYCDECDEWYHWENVRCIEHEDIQVCSDCLENEFEECAECERYFRRSDMYSHDGCLYCEECHEKLELEDEAC